VRFHNKNGSFVVLEMLTQQRFRTGVFVETYHYTSLS
jgi:hypothetical protein